MFKLTATYRQSTVGVEDAVERGTTYAGEIMEDVATVAGASLRHRNHFGAG